MIFCNFFSLKIGYCSQIFFYNIFFYRNTFFSQIFFHPKFAKFEGSEKFKKKWNWSYHTFFIYWLIFYIPWKTSKTQKFWGNKIDRKNERIKFEKKRVFWEKKKFATKKSLREKNCSKIIFVRKNCETKKWKRKVLREKKIAAKSFTIKQCEIK